MTAHSPNQDSPDFDTSTLTHSRTSRKYLIETAWTILAGSFLVISLLPLVAVLTYVIIRGVSRLNLQALTELPPPPSVDGGGFANAIVGTLIMVGLATAISLPFGVLAAIYLSEFGTGRIPRWIRFATNVLSGVPSIGCDLHLICL